MFVLVLAAEADETRQTMSLLIACLIGISVAFTVLTIWYWFYTDPQRVAARDGNGTDDAHDSGARSGPGEEPGPVDAELPAQVEVEAESIGEERADRDQRAEPAAELGSVEAEVSTRPQTWDFVAAARQAEERERPGGRPPATPSGVEVDAPDRSGWHTGTEADGDELAVLRRRRQRASSGLSDDVWDSVRRSVFDKLDS